MSNTWFSDFMRHAAEDKRREVYLKVMELAAIEQAKKMREAMAERLVEKSKWQP